MSGLYAWSVLLHILAAFVFFFAHGVSMATAFLLPKEKDVNKMKLLLDISGITIMPLMVSMLLILITSIHMGWAAKWWLAGWWWVSVAVFFAMIVWMTWYSRKYYSPVRKALGMEYMTGAGTNNPPGEPASMEEVHKLIAKTSPHLLATVGVLVTAMLIWLMRFKPF
jgi:hypothetical protein